MDSKILFHLLIFVLCKSTLQNVEDNSIDLEESSIIDDVASNLLSEENIQNIGGAISNLIQSDGGKEIGDMLMGAATNNNAVTGQILQGLGALLQQNTGPQKGETGGNTNTAAGGGLNPELLGTVFSLLTNQQKTKESSGMDIAGLLQTFMGMAGQDSNNNNNNNGLLNLLPTIIQTVSSFTGPEAHKRELRHADHENMVPPMLERLHVYLDHFANSEMGIALMKTTGISKAMQMFADEDGKFSYPKFVEKFENQNFRKHWITMVTRKMAEIISYFADPYTQKKFTTTFQLFVNNFLKGQGVPKTALFDPAHPTESLTALANFLSKKFLGQKIDAKSYIEPFVQYVQALLNMARDKGIVGTGLDSEKLAHKIADTVNLEFIEPVVRVNRAYRFATKVPECTKYVMCLVNQKVPDEVENFPGLKQSLSRAASMIASWTLSSQTNVSFWSIYHVIIEENNCEARYLDACHDFHVEEIKVQSEYVHNEL